METMDVEPNGRFEDCMGVYGDTDWLLNLVDRTTDTGAKSIWRYFPAGRHVICEPMFYYDDKCFYFGCDNDYFKDEDGYAIRS